MAAIRSMLWWALLGAASLLGCTGAGAVPSMELAESALLTIADLPDGGWEVVEVREEGIVAANLPVSGRPDDCRSGPPDDPLRALERVADERVVLGRSFHRAPRDGASLGERVIVAVVAFDSVEDVDAFLVGGGLLADGDAARAVEPCDVLLDQSSGASYLVSDEPPTLSLADAVGTRTVLTVTDDGTSSSRLIAETCWFVRDRVVAVYTLQNTSGDVDYQALLEEFEQRVLAAQK